MQATKFLDMASDDFRSAQVLFADSLYAQALSHWHQCVEKMTKAFGLTLGITDVTELKSKISHFSLRVMTGGLEKLAELGSNDPKVDASNVAEFRRQVVEITKGLPGYAKPSEITENDISEWTALEVQIRDQIGAGFDGLDWTQPRSGPFGTFDKAQVQAIVESGALDLPTIRKWLLDGLVGLADVFILNYWAQTCAGASRYGLQSGESNREVFSESLPMVRHFDQLMRRSLDLFALIKVVVEKVPASIAQAVAASISAGTPLRLS